MATRTEKSKTICPQCKGNGYVRAVIEEGREEVIADCNKCDNQGEINDWTKWRTFWSNKCKQS